MASIKFKNVCVDFPIYNASSKSFTKRFINVATGGQLNTAKQDYVIIRALENITFSFRDGDRVGIVGHNGAGKSTLLRVLSRIYQPSSGKVNISGSIGSLIDISIGIDHEATGRENIYLRGSLLGMSKQAITKRIDEIIAFSDLGNFVDMPLRTYSSGMHLRLAFAVSTTISTDILLMDEWLSVGDEGFKQKAEARMTELFQNSRILVLASHSKQQIMNNCNRVIWLEHGRICMEGETEEVCSSYFS